MEPTGEDNFKAVTKAKIVPEHCCNGAYGSRTREKSGDAQGTGDVQVPQRVKRRDWDKGFVLPNDAWTCKALVGIKSDLPIFFMPYRDKNKQRTYQKEWMRERRSEFLVSAGPCVQCGSFENREVDHVDRFQKVDHRVWSWSEERRITELAKCQVLCRACHQKKSASELPTRKNNGKNHYRLLLENYLKKVV